MLPNKQYEMGLNVDSNQLPTGYVLQVYEFMTDRVWFR